MSKMRRIMGDLLRDGDCGKSKEISGPAITKDKIIAGYAGASRRDSILSKAMKVAERFIQKIYNIVKVASGGIEISADFRSGSEGFLIG